MDLQGLCQTRSLIRQDVKALIDDIKSRMTDETSSIGELMPLKKSLLEKYEILKKLDGEIEELVELDDLEEEYEASLEFEDSILLTKFRMERLFPELQKYPSNDTVAIASEQDNSTVNNKESALRNSGRPNENCDLAAPSKHDRQEPHVTERAGTFKVQHNASIDKVQAAAPKACSDELTRTFSTVDAASDEPVSLPSMNISRYRSDDTTLEVPKKKTSARDFEEIKKCSAHNERLHGTPKVNQRTLQKHRHIDPVTAGPIDRSRTCCHHGNMTSEGTLLTTAKRDLITPKPKQRRRKWRSRTALRKAGTSSANKAQPKRVIKYRGSLKTSNQEKAPRRRTCIHLKRRIRYLNFLRTRQSTRRPCRMKFVRSLQGCHPGRTTVKSSRLPCSDSARRRYHKRTKHRWKRKYGLIQGGYDVHDKDCDHIELITGP